MKLKHTIIHDESKIRGASVYPLSILYRDTPDTSKITSLLAQSGFFPSEKDLQLIKGWVIFNMEDILTYHIESLVHFRSSVR